MAVSARQASQPAEPLPAYSARRPNGARILRNLALLLVVAACAALLIRACVAHVDWVPTSSMQPTMFPNERIVSESLSQHLAGVQRGQVIVFAEPDDWSAPPTAQQSVVHRSLTWIGIAAPASGTVLVERVIGVGGDHVACCDAQGHIVLNGVPLIEPYVNGRTDQVRFSVDVPNNGLFVLGDNRGSSADSRYHLSQNAGSVTASSVQGHVVAILWPAARASIVSTPSLFANPAIAAGSGMQ